MVTSEKPPLRSKKLWIIAAIVVIVIAIIASLAYLTNSAGTAPPPPAGPNVTIWDTGFCSNTGNCGYSPTSKDIAMETGLAWANTGGRAHTVTECTSSDSSTACPNGAGANTSNARAFDSNAQYSSGFGKGQTFSFTFTNTGTYYYYCTLHPWMHGAVVVS